MSTNTVVEDGGGPGNRWWIPAILALLIVAIIGGALLARNKNLFGSSPTATPRTRYITATPKPATATPKPHTATPKAGPTGTPKPGPTGTPRPGATATARPGPTGTPRPVPTATAGPQTGTITYSQLQLHRIQQGANQKNPQYTFYLDPFQGVQRTLPKYGFTGGFTILSPAQPPQPTPTPFTDSQGQPEVQMTVQYQGHKYNVMLVQPVQTGASGIWVIMQITKIS